MRSFTTEVDTTIAAPLATVFEHIVPTRAASPRGPRPDQKKRDLTTSLPRILGRRAPRVAAAHGGTSVRGAGAVESRPAAGGEVRETKP